MGLRKRQPYVIEKFRQPLAEGVVVHRPNRRVQVSYGKIALRNFRHLRQEARAMRGICCETLRPEAIFPGNPAIWSG